MNTIRLKGLPQSVLLFLSTGFFLFLAGCTRGPTPQAGTQSTNASSASPKRYQLKGTVTSIDKKGQSITINGEDIPGFMSAMTMPYKVKNPSEIDPLSPGDAVTADIVNQGEEYWLENVKATAHPAAPAAKPTSR
jgi:protein SCO1